MESKVEHEQLYTRYKLNDNKYVHDGEWKQLKFQDERNRTIIGHCYSAINNIETPLREFLHSHITIIKDDLNGLGKDCLHYFNKEEQSKLTQFINQFNDFIDTNESFINDDGVKPLEDNRNKIRAFFQDRQDEIKEILTILIKQVDSRQYLHYSHATSYHEKGRFYFFKLQSPNGEYLQLQGDGLKTKILSDLKFDINRTDSVDELNELVDGIKGTTEYDVLISPQGILTMLYNFFAFNLFGVRALTTSEEALEAIIEEQRSNLSMSI